MLLHNVRASQPAAAIDDYWGKSLLNGQRGSENGERHRLIVGFVLHVMAFLLGRVGAGWCDARVPRGPEANALKISASRSPPRMSGF